MPNGCETTKDDKEKASLWRLHPPPERKYQLFPKAEKQRQLVAGKSLDPEQASAVATSGKATSDGNVNGVISNVTTARRNNSLRIRIKEHTLIRRRKISVPELGPLPTVQEVAPKSRKFPLAVYPCLFMLLAKGADVGIATTSSRPPFHERSVSAPGNSWMSQRLQQNKPVDCTPSQPKLMSFCDGIPEHGVYVPNDLPSGSILDLPRCGTAQPASTAPGLSPAVLLQTEDSTADFYAPPLPPRRPMSPRDLAPLVIPPRSSQQTVPSLSGAPRAPPLWSWSPTPSPPCSRLVNTSFDSAIRSAHSEDSIRTRTPVTPFSPLSAVSNTSTLPTPVSATSAACIAPVANQTAPAAKQPPAKLLHALSESWADESDDASRSRPAATVTVNSAATNDTSSRLPATTGSALPQITLTASTTATESPAPAKDFPTSAYTGIPSLPVAANMRVHCRGQSDLSSIVERARLRRRRSASRKASASATINAMSTAAISFSQAQDQKINASTAFAGPLSFVSTPTVTTIRERSTLEADKNSETRAFDVLPCGHRTTEVLTVLGAGEAAALATEALQKTSRFRVLCKKDVDTLSRELHNLEERIEHLRRVCTSLRNDRHALHERICHYLRSNNAADINHDVLLRQQEALAELETAADYQLAQLEQIEEHRACIRQKLLEHVAAAATLPLNCRLTAAAVAAAGLIPASSFSNTEQLYSPFDSSNSSSSCQQTISTPPRSPAKTFLQPIMSSHSEPGAAPLLPSQRPVAQIPLTILEQPLVEEAMAVFPTHIHASAQIPATPTTQMAPATPSDGVVVSPLSSPLSTLTSPDSHRVDVESIRVYAGDDVYALLTDAENHITRIGSPPTAPVLNASPLLLPSPSNPTAQDYFSLPRNGALSREERRRLHRAHSEDLLTGFAGYTHRTPTPPAPSLQPHLGAVAPVTAATASAPGLFSEPPAESPEIFLTSAVFRPERSILAT